MATAYMNAGEVAYSVEDAQIDIQDLIDELELAKADGATHVIGLSGNYRGAQYVKLGLPEIRDEEF